MNNLRRVIGIYFQKVSSYNILNGDIRYDEFDKKDFNSLSKSAFPCLSDTDTEQLYLFLKQNVDENDDALNVFAALKLLSNEFLMIRDSKPICRYNKILSWRQLTKSIGEDLPICAFLAYRKQKTGYNWKDFEWGSVIGHDNMQLNRIMQRGVSDNHFHLFGSAPAFKLIWIKLMNDVLNPKYRNALLTIDNDKLQIREHYSKNYKENSFGQMHFQAALIRAILFSYIHNIKIPFIKKDSCQEEDGCQEARIIIRNGVMNTKQILMHENSVEIWGLELQNYLDSLKYIKRISQSESTDDYANLGFDAKSINHEFEGERALIYQMLCGEIDGEPIPSCLMNWFYAYLAIKVKFREELVQVNKVVGFENFQQYSRRKGNFLYTSLDNKKMIQHAVRGSFEAGNLKSLELRITPSKTAKENSSWIKTCDNIMSDCMLEFSGNDDLKQYFGMNKNDGLKNIYYVFHFPKEKDEDSEIKHGMLMTCRHDSFRRRLNAKAEELMCFREKYPDEAARVLGIDACSQEIGCRPEVFAVVFRRLTHHVVQNPYDTKVKQWKITYHVGEDCLDFTDGLRAINEAVLFLDMKNGDRLGHATFLGLDVKKWYKERRNTVYLPLQDYLDNIVWLYHKLIEFNLTSCETLKSYLLAEYNECFKMLYGDCIKDFHMSYGINTYYEAWKHRDVNPYLFETGKYQDVGFADYMENSSRYMNDGQWYLKQEIVKLLYYYHYSADVRYARNISKKACFPDIYVEGVEKVQKAMQHFIAERGICVEANPSSNLVISSMKKYEEHPICNLFNLGLALNNEELSDCAQVHVSINTDDRGVFHTAIENEYALMGRALEKIEDEYGNSKYNKQMIFDWIERIRQNGNQQSFLEHVEDCRE